MKKQAKASETAEAQKTLPEGFSLPVGKTRAARVPKIRDEGIRKLKLLFTIVDRSKANFYLDMLEQYEVNFQTVIYGSGTAEAARFSVTESDKALLLSVVREDMVAPVLHMLEEKFARAKNGKGIAFTVPFGSVMGVQNYCFLSNSTLKSK